MNIGYADPPYIGCAKRALPAEGPKVIPIRTLRKKYEISGDVATEVNALMRAWEQASEQARKQFLYLVTNRRVG